ATGQGFEVISRSDSTLRGYYPLEVDVLSDELDLGEAVRVLIPFFEEGGRLTVDDVHYVADEDVMVPAGETPFARDASFGFRSSNLKEWVNEKTGGKIAAGEVHSLSLQLLREGGPEAACKVLHGLPSGATCVVNALTARDLEVATCGLTLAADQGRKFLYRTAASFVRVLAGMEVRPLLKVEEMVPGTSRGGLIVVGSYVPKTTVQLEHLRRGADLEEVVVDVGKLLEMGPEEGGISEYEEQLDAALSNGRDVLVYTSREVVTGDDAEASLAIGRRVSDTLVGLVRSLSVAPRFLVAKGGITSSDTATEGLGVREATILGQILPGIPVWQLGEESRFPGMSYIVFPGNVGADDALLEVYRILAGAGPAD
ncbi:MAG: nucleotide-binding domain containing protein, partial [Verrucomicrobiota bacterium]